MLLALTACSNWLCGVLRSCWSLAAAGNDPKSNGAAPVVLWMYAISLKVNEIH